MDEAALLWQCVLCWCEEALVLEGGEEWRAALRLNEQTLPLVWHLLDAVAERGGGGRNEDVLLACVEVLEQRNRAVRDELQAGRRRRESATGSASGLSERSHSSLLQATDERREMQATATAVH